jgi:hypothetical protein
MDHHGGEVAVGSVEGTVPVAIQEVPVADPVWQ